MCACCVNQNISHENHKFSSFATFIRLSSLCVFFRVCVYLIAKLLIGLISLLIINLIDSYTRTMKSERLTAATRLNE